ncbi:hypothetical protein [Elioraea rosea]|uniref:hypothetical protein n=1 Tax=Elioraea rosea TaxID=2492390 RepID=UPI0011841022|nr:hypothetical protein [Elioraea rosea]
MTDAKLRSTWTTKAAQAAFSPGAPVPLPALAALPVLPTSFSTATAEPRRQSEVPEGGSERIDATLSDDGPHERFTWNGPTASSVTVAQVGEPSNPHAAPVRVSDLSGGGADQNAPACRPGDQTSAEKQDDATGDDGPEAPARDSRGGEQGAQLPKCSIEFDPDSAEPDVVAQAPAAPAEKVAGGSSGQGSRAQPDAASNGNASRKPPEADQGDGSQPGQAADGSSNTASSGTSSSSSASASSASTQGQAPADTAPLVVTEATRGIGAAVIDPMLPTDSVTFGSDPALLFPGTSQTVPDPVGDALASATTLVPPVDPTDYSLLG